MSASDLLKNVKFQIALAPQNFFNLINLDTKIEAMELNEKNPRNGRFYHRMIYNREVFVTSTENEVYDL